MSTAAYNDTSCQQLIVDVTDATLTNKLKNAIKMLQGVGHISVLKKKTEMELAREDVRKGRLIRYESKADLFKDLGL